MIDAILWIIIGAMTGWIAYLATRNDKANNLLIYIIVGVVGGVIGGLMMRSLGLVEELYAVNPDSVFSALVAAVLFVGIYTAAQGFLGTSRRSH